MCIFTDVTMIIICGTISKDVSTNSPEFHVTMNNVLLKQVMCSIYKLPVKVWTHFIFFFP